MRLVLIATAAFAALSGAKGSQDISSEGQLCWTTGGHEAEGTPCVFPFTYTDLGGASIKITKCADIDDYLPARLSNAALPSDDPKSRDNMWCSTVSKYKYREQSNKNLGNWGYCRCDKWTTEAPTTSAPTKYPTAPTRSPTGTPTRSPTPQQARQLLQQRINACPNSVSRLEHVHCRWRLPQAKICTRFIIWPGLPFSLYAERSIVQRVH